MFKVNMLFLTFNILCIEESKVSTFSVRPGWFHLLFQLDNKARNVKGKTCVCVCKRERERENERKREREC